MNGKFLKMKCIRNFTKGDDSVRIVVGLGNPLKEFENTRHNIGFMYLDYLFGKDNFKLNKKFNAYEYETNINGEKILFVKPLSYMNLSGEVVIKYINFYKININDLLVIQDDLDLFVGKFKLMYKHGDGGHNGIKNIILNIGSNEFLRLKIGISNNKNMDTKDYVLGKFNGEEIEIINNTFSLLRDFINDYVNLNKDLLMGKYNSKKNR